MRKILCVILAMILALTLFAGCGDTAEGQSESAQQPDAVPESESEKEPLPPPPPPYDPEVLTGLPKREGYPEGQRLTAVMVNNISDNSVHNARPQNGLSEADILMEIKVEGGITRFCALYTDYRNLPEICPVRSARDQFFQVFLPFQPMYMHIGESVIQTQFAKEYDYEALDVNFDKVGFKRDQSKGGVAIEHKAYIDGEQIQNAIDKLGTDTRYDYGSTFFDFVNYNEPARTLTGDDALWVDITHSPRYRTHFDWDADAGKYMMSQYSHFQNKMHDTIDANTGAQLGFDNLVILFTDFETRPDPGNTGYDLQKVNFDTVGYGFYFNGGKTEKIRWKKGAPRNPLQLLQDDGNETSLKVNPGKTYLAIVDLNEIQGEGKFQYYAGEPEAAPAEPEAVPAEPESTAPDTAE